MVVDEAITAAQIGDCITSLGISQLREFHLFDVYTGEGVPTGRKSLALGLILQDLSRTLIDDEVDEIIDRIVTRLGEDLGGSLRV